MDDPEIALLGRESDYECVLMIHRKEEPPIKRSKGSMASTLRPVTGPTKKGKKSLSLLPTMPLDVIFEILGQLPPKGLLNVSRTNKLFRETLLSSGAKTVWKQALESAGAPECPRDLKEPRWARLLFGASCECCGEKRIQKVDFFLRRRVCTACKRVNLLLKSEAAVFYPDCDNLIFSLIPSTNDRGRARNPSGSCTFFWSSDIEEMIRLMSNYTQKKCIRTPGAEDELAVFIAERTALVDEIKSSEKQLRTRFSTSAKFLELGYEASDLESIKYEKAYNLKAALSVDIWKRIRPILEPQVKAAKEQRVAIQICNTKQIRRNLLEELCSRYKNTIPPPQWKYLPGAVELGKKEPFKGLIHAALDVTLTIDDFMPLMSRLPGVVTEIQDELKAKLVQKLAQVSEVALTLPSYCLNFATSVFRCKGVLCGPATYVVGTDSIFSHNCGPDTHLPSHASFARTLDNSRDFVLNLAAAATARVLILCAGLDPEIAFVSEMDNKDLRFACNHCGSLKPFGYTWRSALAHAAAHTTLPFHIKTNSWRVLSPTAVSLLKENEQKDPKWTEAKWSCSHCPIALNHDGGLHRDAVVEHVQAVHEIISPIIPTDLFYFEKVVTPFRRPDRILYASPAIGRPSV